MSCILKKLMLFICLYAVGHAVNAQAPVKRIVPGASPRPIKQLKPTMQKDYNWYLADIKRRYPDFAKKLNTSLAINRAGSIQVRGFSKNRNATLNTTTQSYRQRIQQRYPQAQQQAGMRRLSVQPNQSYQQVAAAQRELARKRMEAVQRGDLK
jgi:hypothetical protein